MSEEVIKDAIEAFEAIEEAESKNRAAWLDDVKFARLADQWPEATRLARERDGRPCLTINRLPAFIKQVTNDARMNKPAIVCHPVGDGADKKTAEILNGLIRNIEYSSNAEVAYDTALECAVTGGFGYFRISSEYAHDDTFDQDLCIERINNPLSVYGDYRSTAADSADWNVAFVTELYTDDEYKAEFGEKTPRSEFQSDGKVGSWFTERMTRVAEYWTRDKVPRKIVQLSSGIVLSEEQYLANKDLFDVQGDTVTGDRETKTHKVTQRIINGVEELKNKPWQGRYIPIVPVYGDEVVVEGERFWLSLVRHAKDPQRMFNYWRTASTELVALAPKAPYIGPRGFASSNPDKWVSANTANHPYLEYDGAVAPQRQPFTGPPPGALQESLNAADDMKSIMGIYDASLGARSNETSGVAINARKREGDVSTFNYVDNLSRAIKHAGRILVDMIPHVYSKERVIRVIHKDGGNEEVQINAPFPVQPGQALPGQPNKTVPQDEAMQDQAEFDAGLTQIYDLTVGKYDVTCTAGPSFTTQRQEAAAQMTEFVRSFPDAAPIIGDLIAKNSDWPGADEIGERLKRLLPPAAVGPNPAIQQLQEQLQQVDAQAREAVGQLQQQLQAVQADKELEKRKLDIDMFNAQTARMKAEAERDAKMLTARASLVEAAMTPQAPQGPQGLQQ